jgi:DNA repair protein RadD
MIRLRAYQEQSIAELRAAIRCGKRRIMLTIPTGGGKTLTATSMILGAMAKGKRCLFVAHRKELIDQTVVAFQRMGVDRVGVIRASDPRLDPDQPIQVASIQTLARRKQRDFDLVIIDEAHRSMATSYTEHLFDRHDGAVIVGLSATPCRTDGKPLGKRFDHLVVGARYSQLIEEGHIVAPQVYSTPVQADLSGVSTTAGDYNQGELGAVMSESRLVGDIYEQWRKHPRERTVAFAVNVAHSMAIVERFCSHGVRAEHLDGKTPEAEREAILRRLGTGETELVSNVGVLCEGWDMPACKTLILARPTKSLGLYMQMAGRIFRPHEGKMPLILDHGDNVDRHGMPHIDRQWSLEDVVKKPKEAPAKVCKSCFAYIPAGSRVCPVCKTEQPAVESERKDITENVIPVDLALRIIEPQNTEVVQLAYFRRMHAQCRSRGWKSQAAVHRYREKFGQEPPREWIEALRTDYRGDAEWKARVAEKQAQKQQQEPALIVDEWRTKASA